MYGTKHVYTIFLVCEQRKLDDVVKVKTVLKSFLEVSIT